MSISSRKKRGAQPANSNALKHGVYSRYYTPAELLALDRDVAGSLQDEMEILRLAVFDLAESILKEPEDSISFHDNASALRAVAVTIARLENIIQVRMTAFGDPDRRRQQVDAMLALMEQSDLEGKEIPSSHSPSPIDSNLEIAGKGSGLDNTQNNSVFSASSSANEPPRPSQKKRGGQPGNSNAYKHGFYASAFTPVEQMLLRGDDANQLRHEETLLRILIRRTWRSMRLVHASLSWQEKLYMLRSVGYAVFVIVKLQRARRRFFGDVTDLEKDIQLGISDACADLGILDYFHGQVEK